MVRIVKNSYAPLANSQKVSTHLRFRFMPVLQHFGMWTILSAQINATIECCFDNLWQVSISLAVTVVSSSRGQCYDSVVSIFASGFR
jgi:hypothetical protein